MAVVVIVGGPVVSRVKRLDRRRSGSRTMKSRPPHAYFLSFWSNVAPAVMYSA
jgi:hypothetical protein